MQKSETVDDNHMYYWEVGAVVGAREGPIVLQLLGTVPFDVTLS